MLHPSTISLWDQFIRQPTMPQCLDKLGGHSPKRPELFLQAFTHISFTHKHPELNLSHYQRLEFLGDAVINLYITDRLYNLFPNMREGELSPIRSSLVCRKSLNQMGIFLGLDKLILLGKGTNCTPSLIEDIFEALVGSIYEERGFTKTCQVLDHLFKEYQSTTGENLFSPRQGELFNNKSRLQEITLKLYGETPQYRHKKINERCFQVDLWIANHFMDSIRQPSKKEAEKLLAKKALEEKLYKNIPHG